MPTLDENVQHYETLAENLKKELRQITQTYDEDHRPRFRFDPVFTGVDPRDEFKKVRDEAEGNVVMQREAWEHLLALDEWPIRTRQMTIDLSNGVKSIFRDVAPFVATWEDRTTTRAGDQEVELVWQGRQVAGLVAMRDLGKVVRDNLALPAIDSDQTERDFAVFISTQSILPPQVTRLIDRRKDPRILFWTPGELRTEERDRLMDFAAYRKLIADWQGKETEDAVAVINWVANALQSDLGKIYKIIPDSYARGQMHAWNNTQMDFHAAGELKSILTPLVDRMLTTAYESRGIKFEPPFIFRKEEGVKLINGIVKTGEIPKGAKPNQNISAAQNFGFGLGIIKKAAEKKLDVSDNPYVQDIWNFLDQHLTDEGQTIKAETLYKNFMGVGGPEQKNYGLTRRMVQIFLLCLVREGRVRVGLNSRSGLSLNSIDYTNIADIDFSARILDAFAEVQKVARPEHWEVLRPYAEKLLDETIEPTHDDSVISACRKRLRELFAREKDESRRVSSQARELFAFLQTPNPYEKEINQITTLFATDITAGNDINLILYGLKEALNYQAFDTNAAQPQEIDDLANRLRNYRDVQHFLTYEREIRAAHAYCTHQFPDREDLKSVRRTQRKLAEKMNELQPFIDSDVKLKTELIGHVPPETGENGTLGSLVHEYTTVYAALHDGFLGHVETEHARIQELLRSSSLRAFRKLEDISALQPAIASSLETQMSTMASELFSCSSPSRVSLEERLQTRPVHDCGLTFSNAPESLATAKKTAESAEQLFNNTLDRKLEVFLSPAAHQRLEQGKKEHFIEELLRCATVNELREVLVPAVLKDESVVGIINRYLKRIKVKKVCLADFRPTLGTIEKEQIPVIVREFQQFLERQLNGSGHEKDELPVLQVE